MIRGGYAPFVGYTDHRLSWFNINWESALGLYQTNQRSVARQLRYDDPRLIKKYLDILKKLLDDEEVVDTVIKLEANATIPLSEVDAAKYEALDHSITR